MQKKTAVRKTFTCEHLNRQICNERTTTWKRTLARYSLEIRHRLIEDRIYFYRLIERYTQIESSAQSTQRQTLFQQNAVTHWHWERGADAPVGRFPSRRIQRNYLPQSIMKHFSRVIAVLFLGIVSGIDEGMFQKHRVKQRIKVPLQSVTGKPRVPSNMWCALKCVK